MAEAQRRPRYTLAHVVHRVDDGAARIIVAAGAARKDAPNVEGLLALRNAIDDLGRFLWSIERETVGADRDEALDDVWERSTPYHEMTHLGAALLATERAIIAPNEAVFGSAGTRDMWGPDAAEWTAEALQEWAGKHRQEVADA